jgi:hypothetical protein
MFVWCFWMGFFWIWVFDCFLGGDGYGNMAGCGGEFFGMDAANQLVTNIGNDKLVTSREGALTPKTQ